MILFILSFITGLYFLIGYLLCVQLFNARMILYGKNYKKFLDEELNLCFSIKNIIKAPFFRLIGEIKKISGYFK